MAARNSNRRNDDGKKRPWGNAYFVQETSGVDNDGQPKTRWIELGPVWQHQDGSGLDFTLAVEPIAWRDSRVERRIVIRKREEQ